MKRTQTRNGMKAQLSRIAEIVDDHFSPRAEESVVDGVQSMAEALDQSYDDLVDAKTAQRMERARCVALLREWADAATAKSAEHVLYNIAADRLEGGA